MAGSTKAPFYEAALSHEKRGIVKGVALMSRASTQPCVEYVSGLLQGVVSDGISKDMMNANQHHEIGKHNAQLPACSSLRNQRPGLLGRPHCKGATFADGDELTDLSTLKERKVNKGFPINRVFTRVFQNDLPPGFG